MPQDLPGYYFDSEKHRYFPIKSPIPGCSSSRNTSSSSTGAQKTPPKSTKAKYGEREIAAKVVKMLNARELRGNSIGLNKRVNFQEQYQKIRASKPIIWKYQGTQRIADAALEHVCLDIEAPEGLRETEILLTGGLNGTFCFYEFENDGLEALLGVQYMPEIVQPLNIEKQTSSLKSPGSVWRQIGALVKMRSTVSSIKIARNYYNRVTDIDPPVSHALITTLGSELSGGSVYLINLSEPLEYDPGIAMLSRRMEKISSFESTVWMADSNSDGNRAAIGTNIGAALLHIEYGRRSWICRSKSDVLSLQFDFSGNIVLCGLRNGTILTVDARQKPFDWRNSEPSIGRGQNFEKQWFERRETRHHSRMISMPSSVSCLAALKLYDQYFLASSMDGTVRLYDHRMTHRGPVQFYEGNVNSHTRIQMGVDPSEKYFISGGEDFYLRMWSIRSGELLYEDKFMDSTASSVCWMRGSLAYDRRPRNHFPGAWLGSEEGIYYVNTA